MNDSTQGDATLPPSPSSEGEGWGGGVPRKAKRTAGAKSAAKRLRREPTEAEKKLWSKLRGRQMDGLQFRRQSPIGPYVVDFLCAKARLVVEVDGGQHAWRAESDEDRTRWLESQGYRVIRFWNNDVLGNIEGVWISIREAAVAPPPQPSPSEEGEGATEGTCGDAEPEPDMKAER